MRGVGILIAILAAVLPAPAPGQIPDAAVAAAGSCLAADCHASLVNRPTPHPPAAAGECTTCHEPEEKGHRFRIVGGAVSALCTGCHDDPAAGKESVHAPVAAGDCTICHDPHASSETKLLRTGREALCEACHVDPGPVRIPGTERTLGARYREAPKLGLTSGRGHPVRGHPVAGVPDPLEPAKPLRCSSCHQPHASDRKSLLAGPAAGGFCARCHSKTRPRPPEPPPENR